MLRRQHDSTRTDTLFPYTTLCRSSYTAARPAVMEWARSGQTISAAQGTAVMENGKGKQTGTNRSNEWEIPSPVRTAQVDLHRLTERSEEHTSELPSLMRISYAVFSLPNKTTTRHSITSNTNS